MRHFKTLGVLIAMSIIFVLSGCARPATKSDSGLQVVTTLKVYAEAANAVLGDHGHAEALISSPDIAPHDYEAGTDAAKYVAKADLLIMNGLGYDDWMNRLAAAAKKPQLLTVATTVMGKKEGDNEHVFYDPQLMFKLAPELAKRFAKLDPDHAADYKANAEQYLKTLKPLTEALAKAKAAANGRRVASSEPVFDEAVTAAGYQLTATAFARAVEEGTDPAPRDVADLRHAISSRSLAFFVNNVQADSPVVAQMVALAKRHDVRVVNVRETQPAGKSYLEWMLANYKQMQVK